MFMYHVYFIIIKSSQASSGKETKINNTRQQKKAKQFAFGIILKLDDVIRRSYLSYYLITDANN